jgi:ribosomal-protein-alanine N-acetyltransferase
MKIFAPPYKTFPVLKNHRIILREILDKDLQQLIEISFYDGVPAKNIHDAQFMNEKIKLDYLNGNSIHWVITSTLDGDVLGTCGFYRGFQEECGEIGYVLKNAHQGHGYMADALSLLLDFGWNSLGLTSIKAVTANDNQASMKVLTKAGFNLSDSTADLLSFKCINPCI